MLSHTAKKKDLSGHSTGNRKRKTTTTPFERPASNYREASNKTQALEKSYKKAKSLNIPCLPLWTGGPDQRTRPQEMPLVTGAEKEDVVIGHGFQLQALRRSEGVTEGNGLYRGQRTWRITGERRRRRRRRQCYEAMWLHMQSVW